MDAAGVTCVDCHMAMATKSAEALGPYKGDVRTHLFTIDTDPNASMFTEDGKFVALDEGGKASITLDFACLQCHTDNDLQWAAAGAANFHAPAPSPAPAELPVTGIGPATSQGGSGVEARYALAMSLGLAALLLGGSLWLLGVRRRRSRSGS